MIDPIPFVEHHFVQTAPVYAEGIPISAEVRKLCERNSCGKYGQNWTCPPAVESLGHFKKTLSADKAFPFLILGAGACHLREPCNYVNGKPCRYPQDAIVSLEAIRIDVMRLLKNSGLKYYHGTGTVTYVGGLFHNHPSCGRAEP